MPTKILPFDCKEKSAFEANDRIFLGEGLFETIRVENQQAHYASLHWQRMRLGALSLGISFDLSCEEWCKAIERCVNSATIQVKGIKIILSGGAAPRGLEAHGETPVLLFTAFTYSLHQKAMWLVTAPWLRDAKNPVYRLKSINYLESIMARRYALASGADDALFFNLDHYATETSIANLFIIKDDHLYTPLLTAGVLDGIIRSRILHLCGEVGIPCSETMIDRTKISQADAVFVTNALQGIRSVKGFDEWRLTDNHLLVTVLQNLLAEDQKLM